MAAVIQFCDRRNWDYEKFLSQPSFWISNLMNYDIAVREFQEQNKKVPNLSI